MVSKNKERITITIKKENLSFADFVCLNLQCSRSELLDSLLEQYKNWYLGDTKNEEKK